MTNDPISLANALRVIGEELAGIAKLVAAIGVIDPHWLEYPLDRLAPVSGEFGVMYTIGGKTWQHEGIDFSIASGNPVRACAVGKIVYAGFHPNGYGNYVRIEHEHEGEVWWTAYAHLSLISVKRETRVRSEELIGLTGATGNVTGAHLHLTVQRAGCTFKPDGCAETLRGVVNPRNWVKWPT